MVQESALGAATGSTLEKIESAVSGTLITAKDLIKEGLEKVADTFD